MTMIRVAASRFVQSPATCHESSDRQLEYQQHHSIFANLLFLRPTYKNPIADNAIDKTSTTRIIRTGVIRFLPSNQ